MSTWNWRKAWIRGTMSCRRKNLDSIVCFALFSWSIFIFVFCLRLLFFCCCKLLCFISLKQVVFWRSLCESVSLLLFSDHFLRELITRSLKHFGEHAGGPDISICLVSSVSRHRISRGRLLLCEGRAFLLWFLVSFLECRRLERDDKVLFRLIFTHRIARSPDYWVLQQILPQILRSSLQCSLCETVVYSLPGLLKALDSHKEEVFQICDRSGCYTLCSLFQHICDGRVVSLTSQMFLLPLSLCVSLSVSNSWELWNPSTSVVRLNSVVIALSRRWKSVYSKAWRSNQMHIDWSAAARKLLAVAMFPKIFVLLTSVVEGLQSLCHLSMSSLPNSSSSSSTSSLLEK